jgi:ubiquinone/menaquinone biosynthesis C-methylase UbiE
MSDQSVYFYTRHPISAAIILKKLREQRGHLDAVRPDELFAHDQDHYGGLAANDALAAAARIGKGTRVADFCAGLGGPARYLAHRCGADVTGIELTPARVEGAAALTRLVGLSERVRVIGGNVMSVPLGDASIDAVISQEAMLHVPEKGRALREAFRILRRGRRLAFTDWTVNAPLGAEDADLLWRGMAAQSLQSVAGYRALLEETGFAVLAVEDLTREWAMILTERLAMYQRLRREAQRAGTPQGHDAFHESYVRFVALVQQGVLGGARFTAEKS